MIMGSTRTLVILIGYVDASLDKAFYYDYLCWVASNKQQIYVERSQTSTGKLGKWLLLSGCGFVQRLASLSLSRGRRLKTHHSIND